MMHKVILSTGELELINLGLKFLVNYHSQEAANFLSNPSINEYYDQRDAINSIIELRGRIKQCIRTSNYKD